MSTLTDVQIRHWIKAGAPVAKSDGDGLTFTLSAKGTAAWTLRYYIGAKRKELTLGRYPDTTLSDARKLATAKRAAVQQGVDVAREKQRTIKETARAWTFERLAEDYLTRSASNLSPLTISGRRQQLRDYVLGRIGTPAGKRGRAGRYSGHRRTFRAQVAARCATGTDRDPRDLRARRGAACCRGESLRSYSGQGHHRRTTEQTRTDHAVGRRIGRNAARFVWHRAHQRVVGCQRRSDSRVNWPG